MTDDTRTEFLRRGGASFHWFSLKMTLDGLRAYLPDLDAFLKVQLQQERAEWKEKHPELPVCGNYTDVLPKVLRQSFIVALMIKAEETVKQACTDVGIVARNEYDPSGTPTFEVARAFLTEHGRFKKPAQHRWAEVETIWTIRNAIVHGRGHPRIKAKERIKRLAKKVNPHAAPRLLEKMIGPDANLPVHLDGPLCEHALNVVDEFLDELHKELHEFIFRIRDAEGITSPYDNYDDDAEAES